MRSTIRENVKGVATMRYFVAVLLVLTMFSSGAVTLGQNPPRRSADKSAPQTQQPPKSDTIKICQGVPVPDGYVVVAYMTSAACPHGAYLLRKQSDYESSLSVNGDARTTANPSNAATTSTTSPKSNTQTGGRTGSSGKARTSSQSDPSVSTSSAAKVTRPRVVASNSNNSSVSSPANSAAPPQTASIKSGVDDLNQTQDDATAPPGPPSLTGGQPGRPLGPPTLGNAGAGTSSSSTSTQDATAAATGPEEVGEGDVVRVNTSLVTVPVSVVDHQGRFVPNMKREDFHLFENGVEQSLAYFEPAEKPFTVALLLDMSASTHFHVQEIREAAIAFAKQLRPQDRVLVVTFNDEVLLLTPNATNDLDLVETLVDEYANTGSSTRLYDAVHLTIRERLNQIKGRKAIVLFTDGVDTSSQQATYQSTLREAEELDALIYPVQYDTTDYLQSMQGAGNTVTVVTTTHGLFGSKTTQQTYNVPANNGQPLPGTTKADYDRADKYLHALADETGGRIYQANDTKQLADAFSRIAEELRRQYSLGYYPKSGNDDDNARRDIKVRVRQPNLAVKARDSYTKASTPSQK